MELSKYQKDIVNAFNNTDDNLFINAYAGSGKSFMLLELSKYINSYSVFIAFNKNIQEELKTKINNPKFKAYTFNGLGYQIMRYNWEEEQKKIAKKNPEHQVQELTVDPFKSNELSSLVCSEKKDILDFELISIKDSDDENLEEEDVYVSFVNDLSHLFDLCRQRMVNFSDETKVFETIEFYELFSDIIEIPSNIMELLNKMLVLDIEWANEGKIDFIDQLYITYFKVFQKQWKVPFWNQFENIFIDECLTGDTYIIIWDEINKKEKRIKLKTLYDIYDNSNKWLVKSYNHESNVFEFKKILNVKKHNSRDVLKIETEGLNVVKATGNHRFLTQRGYVAVEDLIIGKDILSLDNIEYQKTEHAPNFVSNIQYVGKEDVYDIEVEDNHNFVCCSTLNSIGIISHNCQDLSKLQQLFISLIKRQKGRVVGVGDFFQSVYSFAGADCHSIDTLKRLYNLKEFNLPINYRCPQKHLRYVNRKYEIPIQARPDAPEGILQTIEYKNLPYFVEKGDCIISRKNADLCKTALKLLECNKAVYIRDEKLVDRLITKIFSFKNVINSLSEMDEHIKKLKKEQHAAIEKRTEKLIEKGVVDNEQVENTTFSDSSIDLLDCLQVLLENYRNKPNSLDDFSSFINYVRQMLNTKERRGAIELTSIHQAKGKEWDRVFVLNNARIFREYAKTSDQLQQETNLSYVAVTRSKDTLYLVEETVEKKDEESPEDSNFENYEEDFDE